MSTFESMSLLGGVLPLTTTSLTATQETTSSFKWNGRNVGLAVGTGVLVITCVALGVLINPAFFGAIPLILGGAWALMGSPTLNDLLGGGSTATTPEQQPLLASRNPPNYRSVTSNDTVTKTNGLRPYFPLPDEDTDDDTGPNDLGSRRTPSYQHQIGSELDQTAQRDFASTANDLLASIRSGKNLDTDKIQLNSYLRGYPTSADQFLGCALELYNKQKNPVSNSSSPLDQLGSIEHNIRLADDMIENTPENSEIAQQFTSIKQELESRKTSLLTNLEAAKTAEVESLRTIIDRSAEDLGQNVFPGQLSGYSAGYTLAGELSAVLEGTTVDGIAKDRQSASERITSIRSAIDKYELQIHQSNSEVTRLETELQAQISLAQAPAQDFIVSLPSHSTAVVERNKLSQEKVRINQEIEANKAAISQANTRAELLPLVKKRYQLELNLLTCEYRYEILQAHIELNRTDRTTEVPQYLNQQIEKLGDISNRLNALKTNAQHLQSEIDRFQKADESGNDREKEIARKNIARLIADPYTTNVIPWETSNEFSNSIATRLYIDVLKKDWFASKTSLGEHLESIDYLPTKIDEISRTRSELQTTLQIFGGAATSIETLLSRKRSEDEKLSSAHSNLSMLESELRSATNKLSEAEKKQKAVDKALGELTDHIMKVCSSTSFNKFIDGYKEYARAAGIPEQQWAGEILEKLNSHFPQLIQFPQLKEPVLNALQANKIDITPIVFGSSISATTTSNRRAGTSSYNGTPFGAMMSSSSMQPNFDDQFEWIRKFESIKTEFEKTIPTSSSSSTNKYAPYDKDDLEDCQEFLNDKLTDLRQITLEGDPVFAAQVTQTEKMVRAELSAVNSELEKRMR